MWPFAKAGCRIPGQPFSFLSSFFFWANHLRGKAASRKPRSPVCQLRCATNQGIRSPETFSQAWLSPIYHSHLYQSFFCGDGLLHFSFGPSHQLSNPFKIKLRCPDCICGIPLALGYQLILGLWIISTQSVCNLMVQVLLTTWGDTVITLSWHWPVWAYHKKHSRLPESVLPKMHIIIRGAPIDRYRLVVSKKVNQKRWLDDAKLGSL